MERHAHHRQPCHTRVTQRGRPSDPDSDPIRFQRIQRSGGAIERTIERIVVAVIPEPLAVVGRYVRGEAMD